MTPVTEPTASLFPGPRLRGWPFAVAALALAVFGWTVHFALGVALTVFAIGLAFRFPGPEDEHAAALADRRRRHAAAIRRARAATPLRPTGEVDVDGTRRTARMLSGFADADTELEVVNELDGELIVRRL